MRVDHPHLNWVASSGPLASRIESCSRRSVPNACSPANKRDPVVATTVPPLASPYSGRTTDVFRQ